MGIDHYHIMTIEGLENYIKSELFFKRYFIIEFSSNSQISIFLPIKSKTIRKLIKDEISKLISVSVKIYILKVKWYQGWFKKYKRETNENNKSKKN